MPVNWKKVLLFLGLTFLVDWGIAGIYYLIFGPIKGIGVLLLGALYMLIPFAMAALVQKAIYREGVLKPLGIQFRMRWKWLIPAVLLPPLIGLLTYLISLQFPGIAFAPGMQGYIEHMRPLIPPDQFGEVSRRAAEIPPLVVITQITLMGILAGLTINAVFALGEEAGWRGFLQRELAPLGFWPSSLIIGAIWGIWHAPLIIQGYNYPEHPVIGIGMMTIFTLLYGILHSYVRLQARSTLAAAVLHGTLNGTPLLPVLYLRGGNDLTVGIMGLAGFLAIALVIIALTIYDTKYARTPLMYNRTNVLKAVGLVEE